MIDALVSPNSVNVAGEKRGVAAVSSSACFSGCAFLAITAILTARRRARLLLFCARAAAPQVAPEGFSQVLMWRLSASAATP